MGGRKSAYFYTVLFWVERRTGSETFLLHDIQNENIFLSFYLIFQPDQRWKDHFHSNCITPALHSAQAMHVVRRHAQQHTTVTGGTRHHWLNNDRIHQYVPVTDFCFWRIKQKCEPIPPQDGWFCGINQTEDLTCMAVDRWRRRMWTTVCRRRGPKIEQRVETRTVYLQITCCSFLLLLSVYCCLGA